MLDIFLSMLYDIYILLTARILRVGRRYNKYRYVINLPLKRLSKLVKERFFICLCEEICDAATLLLLIWQSSYFCPL